jgi:hypothetical protein
MRSRLPDERALTWLGLSLEKLGLGVTLEALGLATLAWAGEPAAQPAPVAAATTSAAEPSNEVALRGLKDILLGSIPALSRGSLDVPSRMFGCSKVTPLDQEQ